MTKNILVGFDGSPESNEALLWAAAEAAARERPLEIVSCYRLPMATDAYTGTPPDATAKAGSDAAVRAAPSRQPQANWMECGRRMRIGASGGITVFETAIIHAPVGHCEPSPLGSIKPMRLLYRPG